MLMIKKRYAFEKNQKNALCTMEEIGFKESIQGLYKNANY